MFEPIEWGAPEFHYREKNADWYWILGIIVVTAIVIALLLKSILFAIFLAVGGFLIALFASKRPDIIHYRIDSQGVYINDTLYPYYELSSFWVDQSRPERPQLLITLQKKLALQVIISLEGVDPDMIRNYVFTHEVDERPQRESIAERIMEWAKL